VVTVVRNCDQKSVFEINREVRVLSQGAREGALEPGNFRGGTFTLTSGGRLAVDMVTPIISPPQTAILALGLLAPRPTVYKGALAIRESVNFCLTHDHRVIDGKPAGEFITRLKEIVEAPEIFRDALWG
jgi:pyruvate/2-oxoglutarate dehydrogenase complex dihydrolipoamide acyltransferase (E2) component